MSVKKKDRHLSKLECLNQARNLVQYILVITRPKIIDEIGKIKRAGPLGEGQAYQAFGIDIFKCGKAIHAHCYQALEIYLKDKDTLESRREHFKIAIEYCDSITRLIDLCIFQYAQNTKKNYKSFQHLAKLTYNVKNTLKDKMNRDNLIYQQKLQKRLPMLESMSGGSCYSGGEQYVCNV